MTNACPVIREEIAGGVYFSDIAESRFKSNLLTINLILPRRREDLTCQALIPLILEKASREYPTPRAFSRYLNTLYGAGVGSNLSKSGDYAVVTLYCSVIDNRFALRGEDLLTIGAETLAGLLFTPLTVDSGYDPEITRLQKEYLADSIRAFINEKRSYALGQTVKAMFEDTPYGLPKYGFLDDIPAITPQSALKTFEALRDSARIEIFHVGAGDAAKAKEIFASAFKGRHFGLDSALAYPPAPVRDGEKSVTERMRVNQAKLCLGFTTKIAADSPLSPALRVANAILGGTATSKLFLNVREKKSLCYYCSSRIDRSKGILLIDSGVEAPNAQKARAAILEEVEALKAGDFTDVDLQYALLSLKNTFRSTGDTPGSLEGFYLSQALLGSFQTPEAMAEETGQVTREEVITAARQLKLDTVYLLTGEEDSDGND